MAVRSAWVMFDFRSASLGALLCASWSSVAWADADEMTLAVGAKAGAALSTDSLAQDRGSTGVLGGEGRFSYATSDWFRYELAIASFVSGEGEFRDVEVGGVVGTLQRSEVTFRALAGVTATLGVRWVPTLTIVAGAQRRQTLRSQLESGGIGVAETGAGRGDTDFLVGVGGGVSRRFGRRWSVSARVLGVIEPVDSVNYLSFEGALSLEYHFYP